MSTAVATSAATLRGYQDDAVRAVTRGLAHGGRGQVHAACGTGKTLVALRATEALVPGNGLVVVLSPSIGLVAQTLAAWERDRLVPFEGRAVCSDETVTGDDGTFDDLVSTDPEVISRWLSGPGRKVIAGTYKSAHALGRALRDTGTRAALVVCDEAHRLAGPAGKAGSVVLGDDAFPADRRLFLTATPRLTLSDMAPGISMDDKDLFGPVLYEYPFARAIADGWLDDYRVAVIGVADSEVRAMLADRGSEYSDPGSGVSLGTMAAQVALARAAAKFGIRRAVTFHARVAEAAEFARTLGSAVRRMPDESRPVGTLSAFHVHGQMSARQRHGILDGLREPPGGGWSVVSNAKCLTEGIDVPAIDAVLFASPRESVTDVAQAVGRALLPSPGGGTATIIVPVILSPGGQALDLESGEFDTVWRVVRAMRGHDETLATGLDFARAHWTRGAGQSREDWDPVAKVCVLMPGGIAERLAASLSLAVVTHASSPWWDGYAHAAAFREGRGHLLVPNTHVTASGFPLGTWIAHARQHHANAVLPPDRIAALEKLGMEWNAFTARWEENFRAAEDYRAECGNLFVPQGHVTASGIRLGWWIKTQRGRRAAGQLSDDRAGRLDRLGMAWGLRNGKHERALGELRAFRAEHGHLNVPQRYVTPGGYMLGRWVAGCRARKRAGDLSPDLAQALEEMGMRWQVRASPKRKQGPDQVKEAAS